MAIAREYTVIGPPLPPAGEDYQLLLAVPPEEVEEVRELARVFGVETTSLGAFFEGEPAVRLRDAAGERPLPPGGHDHFRVAPA